MKSSTTNPLALVALLVLAVLLFRLPAPPDPTPPDPEPRPVSKIAERVREIVRRLVPAADRRQHAAQLAEICRDVAAEVERLKDPLHRSEIKRPQDAVDVANRRIDAALGTRLSAWHPARSEIAALLAESQAAGEIGLSVYDVGRALAEVARGLE